MKKITKKQSDSFNKTVTKLILENGFKELTGEIYRYEKDTNFGKVFLSLQSQQGSTVYSIFSRFDDVNKALSIFNCNRFTGKYNFHFFDAQECVGSFEFFLHELEYKLENFGK